MEEYIDQIEQFLRGQMNQREEIGFKEGLRTNLDERFLAFSITTLLNIFGQTKKNE